MSVTSAGTVYLDGAQKGALAAGQSTTLTDVATGSRRVEVRYANGQSETQTITVAANQTASANFAYAAPVGPALGETWTSPNGFRMVGVPAGSFTRGLTPEQVDAQFGEFRDAPWYADWRVAMTPHRATVSGFWMMQTEVTQGLYQTVMGSNPSDTSYGIGTNNPVNVVSWYDALVFANRLSMREGLTPVYTIGGSTDPSRWGSVPTDNNGTWNAATMNRNANGYRLPTEAEWEYAARGASASPNTQYAGSSNVNDVAWYRSNSGSRTQPVGTKAANELGLHDMSGNVWEWCWDWYGSYAANAQSDPTGPASGTARVVRGGSCYIFEWYTRVAYRSYHDPQFRLNSIGFRLLRAAVR